MSELDALAEAMNKALADVQTEPESAVKEFHIEIGMITSRLEAVRAVKGSTADLSAYLAKFDAVDGSRSVSSSKTESLLCAGPCSNFKGLQTTDSLTELAKDFLKCTSAEALIVEKTKAVARLEVLRELIASCSAAFEGLRKARNDVIKEAQKKKKDAEAAQAKRILEAKKQAEAALGTAKRMAKRTGKQKSLCMPSLTTLPLTCSELRPTQPVLCASRQAPRPQSSEHRASGWRR